MTSAESSWSRKPFRLMLVDSRGFDRSAVVAAADAARCGVRTLPSAERARVHLARDERFDALVIPPRPDGIAPERLAAEARALRAGLPLLVLAEGHEQVEAIRSALRTVGIAQDARTRVVVVDDEAALRRAIGDLVSTLAMHTVETPAPHRVDDALHAHHRELTDRARQRHDVLTTAIEDLDRALAVAAVHREKPWSERAGRVLERVREAMRAHSEEIEEPEGLFDEIEIVAPRFADRVEALRAEHAVLGVKAAELAGAIVAHAEIGAPALRRRAAALLDELRAHRASEADLIFESLWTELGAGD